MVKMDDIKAGAAIADEAPASKLVPPPRRSRTRWTRLIVIGGVTHPLRL